MTETAGEKIAGSEAAPVTREWNSVINAGIIPART
jgi:hypothetical protein